MTSWHSEHPSGQTPTISIITVVRNGANVLREAIESVVRQVGQQVEYIIVDGASTDGTVDIVREYQTKLAYWTSEADSGIYDAMNKAMLQARGRWILFLGADDVLQDCLADVVPELRVADAVYHGDVTLLSSGKTYGGRFGKYRIMQQNICHQAVFYPRSVFSSKSYDREAGPLADHKYNIELMGEGVKFLYLARTISRFNDFGISSTGAAAFEKTKMRTIRASLGISYFVVKRIRTTLVTLLKSLG